MFKLTIDGKPVEIQQNATILAAVTKAGVDIPTLCFNEELSPAGACRLCVVEVLKNGESALVTACDNPVSEGMVVNTASPGAIGARRLAAELLLAQNPTSPRLKKIAERLGIREPRFSLPYSECILCRQCTRACREVVGAGAISFVPRGMGRDAEPRLLFDVDRCIACGSCAFICPTDAIKLVDTGGKRTITTPDCAMEFVMRRCEKCGCYFAPEKQLDYMSEKSGLPREKFTLCLDCRD
jgi:bidirectional [NiFe] hydrogenase diaphorase subunit